VSRGSAPAGGDLRVVGGRVLRAGGWIDADVAIRGDRIASVDVRPSSAVGPPNGRRPGREPSVLDATGLLVAPGFIDLQVNGAFGHDVTSDPPSIWAVAAGLPRTGVTAFLPTVVSAPLEAVAAAMAALAAGPPPGHAGAGPIGLHLEGPMLAEARAGAHEPRFLRPPSPEVIEGWFLSAGVRLVTLAPELPGAIDVIGELRARGIVVSAGHSEASADQATAGFEAGVAAGTHLFNAMPSITAAEPGLAGTLLARDDVTVGLIADGVHVPPERLRAAWTARGGQGIALVSDATSAMGMPEGRYELGGRAVHLRGGEVRDDRGVLSGSALSMDRAVRTLVREAGASPAEALTAASTTPARLLGLADRGRVEPGARADLVLLDQSLQPVATVVGGSVLVDTLDRSGVRAG
jgi:N-acetylglucosamine-6-phosphate deacetylase